MREAAVKVVTLEGGPVPGPEPVPQPARPARPAPPGRAADELRYLILAVQREGSRRLAARLRDAGLTPAQAEVLDVLRDRAPLSLAELGRLLVCETGSPSRLVDALVQRGLVTRTPSPQDRRVVSLALTEAGREAQAVSAGSADVREVITSRLTGQQIGQLSGLLRRLIEGTPGGAAIDARFPAEGR
ncbi:MAG TPA: MarR family transcriptional regulator [Streptosporangiaceae bacterium]